MTTTLTDLTAHDHDEIHTTHDHDDLAHGHCAHCWSFCDAARSRVVRESCFDGYKRMAYDYPMCLLYIYLKVRIRKLLQ
jgi:hypothetical protein